MPTFGRRLRRRREPARWLERCPEGHVTGLDYSAVSVATAQKYNRQAIAEGRCAVVQGNVAELPFEDDTFDVVSAFETVYFWPGLERCFAEVLRVLKPGGLFFLCNETDGNNPEIETKWMKKTKGCMSTTRSSCAAPVCRGLPSCGGASQPGAALALSHRKEEVNNALTVIR